MSQFALSPLEDQVRAAVDAGLIYCEEFDYVARWLVNTATSLAATSSVEIPVQIDGTSDFVVEEYDLTAFDNAGTPALVAAPNFLISFTKDGSGRRLSSGPVHVLNICGNYSASRYPGRLSYPVLLPSKSTYSVLLQNLSATAMSAVDLRIHGFKVFYIKATAEEMRSQIFHVL